MNSFFIYDETCLDCDSYNITMFLENGNAYYDCYDCGAQWMGDAEEEDWDEE